MKSAIWISYDLGVKGDYPGLYTWLDSKGATECGDSLAFITYSHSSKGTLLDDLKSELRQNIEINKRTRIYVIYRNDETKMKGTFLMGSRRGAPWAGYSSKATEDDEA